MKNKKYRIVVIGSGIGGMASASLFSKAGHIVNVLEMNQDRIGGHGRWLTFGGVNFSMGPQYVWEFGPGETGMRFMEYLGITDLNPFELMSPDGFESLFIGHRYGGSACPFIEFRVPLGLDNFKRKMVKAFPDESEQLERLFDDMIEIFQAFKNFFNSVDVSSPRLLLMLKYFLYGGTTLPAKRKLLRVIYMTLKEFFDYYGISSIPRRILYGHGGIFAEPESDMSAIAFIVGTGNYHLGAHYPGKGFHSFFNSLADVIKNNGGSVETGKKVVKLETELNSVKKVICSDGSMYDADYVFSDISPRLTERLTGGDTGYSYAPSNSIPAVCIGIRKGLPSIDDMMGRNYWWQDGSEINYCSPDVTSPPAMLFINSPTANGNSGLTENDKDALVVFCPGCYEMEKSIYSGGENAIMEFKKKLAEDVVEILEINIFPGIRERVIFTEVVSSVDVEIETGSEMGNAYGKRMSREELLKKQLKVDIFENLYNVSATENTPGIAGGINTALKLFEKLSGLRV